MKLSGSGLNFTMYKDGTVRARAGVQTNCAGIAMAHVRIMPNNTREILFQISECEGEHDDGYGFAVPALAVPTTFREAIFEGAKQAFEDNEIKIGIDFELLDAMVHQVDARENKFKLAGYLAVEGWLDWYSQKSAK